MAPRQFGKYLIIQELGSGATADVSLAQDTSQQNKEVALKILKPVLVADRTAFLRFQQEASTAAQLKHDNIANVLEVGEYAGYFYIAMRYIKGEALDKVLKRGVLSWQMAARLVQQIGSALDYAHNLGFIHRDVKPANIMMTPEGNFILTDFGLARAIENSGLTSTTGAVLGTPPYIPPEVWNTGKAVPASDQYALACVVAEALTGKQVFSGTTPQMVLTRHLITGPELPATWPSGVPAGVGAVLQRALDKDPSKRFRNTVQFATTLLHAPQTPPPPPPPARKPFPKLLVGIVIGLVLVAAAIFTFITLQNQSNQEKTQAALTAARANLAFSKTVTVSPKSPTLAPTVLAPEPTKAPLSSSTQPPTQAAASLTPTTVEPTKTPLPGGAQEVLLGTGVKIETVSGSGLIFRIRNGAGTPLSGKFVRVYSQKKDLSGNWVKDQEKGNGYTDNTGTIKLDKLASARYIVCLDINGYNWGTAGDCDGQADVPVDSGKATQLTLSLTRLTVGFLRADKTVMNGQFVRIYTQKKDLANNWVSDKDVASGYTDNSGAVSFDLAPGYYIVTSNLTGYNWGTAGDHEGMANVPLRSAQVYPLTVNLGQLVVGLLDGTGKPRNGVLVRVYTQKKDVSSNFVTDGEVDTEYTNNTGSATFNLTPGNYAIRVDNNYLFNIAVAGGNITTTDGKTFQFK